MGRRGAGPARRARRRDGARHGRRVRLRAVGREVAGRGGCAVRAAPRHRQHRRRARAVPRSCRCKRSDRDAAEQHRPHAPLRRRAARRGSRAGVGRGRHPRGLRCRRRAPAPTRDRRRDRRERGCRADRVRLHARLDVQPLLVRPSARVVPGAQAPLRRHEDVARSEPRARLRRPRAKCRPRPTASRRR